MKKSIFILGIWLVIISCSNQPQVNFSRPSVIPAIKSSHQHQVMILGTFHFDRALDGSDVVQESYGYFRCGKPASNSCFGGRHFSSLEAHHHSGRMDAR